MSKDGEGEDGQVRVGSELDMFAMDIIKTIDNLCITCIGT